MVLLELTGPVNVISIDFEMNNPWHSGPPFRCSVFLDLRGAGKLPIRNVGAGLKPAPTCSSDEPGNGPFPSVSLTDGVPALALEIVGGAEGQGLDGRCGIDAGAGGEDAAVNDEHVGNVMAAAPAVDYRVSGIVTHPGRSQQVPAGVAAQAGGEYLLGAGSLHDFSWLFQHRGPACGWCSR